MNAWIRSIIVPVQGTSSDIIKVAMINLYREMRERGFKSRMLLQVHDELVLEVAERDVEPVEALVRREMASAASLGVPLEVEVGHGRSWADAH